MKKQLMIPFRYYSEEMLDWYNHTYKEGQINSDKMFWDTVSKQRVHEPFIRSYIYSGEQYEKAIAEDQRKLAEFNQRVKDRRYVEVDEVLWKPNFEFKDTLKYNGYSRGCSSAKIHFFGEITGKHYEMFLSDFDDLMDEFGFNKNVVSGIFTFVKRGANYGIKIVRK